MIYLIYLIFPTCGLFLLKRFPTRHPPVLRVEFNHRQGISLTYVLSISCTTSTLEQHLPTEL